MWSTSDVDPWTTSVDLHVELGAGGRRESLLAGLRDAVRTGRLAPGTRLPSSRALAADLGVARGTVAVAYAELVAEGWLTARQGSATRVSDRVPAPSPVAVSATAVTAPVHDLRPGSPDPASFPRTAWVRAAGRAMIAAPSEAFGPGDPRGRVELRRELAGYLARARGVRADPDRIVVCSGVLDALRLLAPLLAAPLAVEEYGLFVHRQLLDAAGLATVPIGVDGDGAQVVDVPDAARDLLLTPAHQYPLGRPLAPSRRAAIVDRARRTGGLVLEDDYDGDFRYDRRPVGALQGLDPEHVVYLGSVSKSLSPALRVGWMVLPARLVDEVVAAKGLREPWVGVTEQLTLAELVASGAYDRHLRGMRRRYRRRRDLLLAGITASAPHVRVSGIAAGLHAVLDLPAGTEDTVLARAAASGVGVVGLATHRHPRATSPPRDGLIVSYGTPPEHGYPAALGALLDVLALNRG